MSTVDSITALSGYQVQSNNLASQIASLQAKVGNIITQAQLTQAKNAAVSSIFSAGFGTVGNPTPDSFTSPQIQYANNLSAQYAQQQAYLSQISDLNTQKTNLDQIIAQLQGNITTYVSPVSATHPTTSSDTAHNIANTLSSGVNSVTSALSSVPKTDLYIGLGLLGLILLLK